MSDPGDLHPPIWAPLGDVTTDCSVPQQGNGASSRVCERIGMRFEREVVIPACSRRGQLAGLLYAMSRAEWFARAESLDTRGTATPHRKQ